MNKLDFLHNHFQESAIRKMAEIFQAANATSDHAVEEQLRAELLSVLQSEKDNGLILRGQSPSQSDHIVISKNLCMFVNIYGAHVLIDNWLFWDGEMWILNFQWLEEVHLVAFDVHFIVDNKWEKCICHYGRTDFFTCLSQTTSTPSQISAFSTDDDSYLLTLRN